MPPALKKHHIQRWTPNTCDPIMQLVQLFDALASPFDPPQFGMRSIGGCKLVQYFYTDMTTRKWAAPIDEEVTGKSTDLIGELVLLRPLGPEKMIPTTINNKPAENMAVFVEALILVDSREPERYRNIGVTAIFWEVPRRQLREAFDSGETIAAGLSMPHSPRRYADRLWILESGAGTIALVDEQKGSTQTIAQLPGFTRGISFFGRYAFIGLSQVRESAVFSGIPITQRVEERTCGVWVVDIESGQTAAFLRFEEGVQEIFAVEVLPGIRYPDIVNDDAKIIGNSFVLPDQALADVQQR